RTANTERSVGSISMPCLGLVWRRGRAADVATKVGGSKGGRKGGGATQQVERQALVWGTLAKLGWKWQVAQHARPRGGGASSTAGARFPTAKGAVRRPTGAGG